MMAHPDASDDDLINIIQEDFSDAPTMNEAREELLHMRQKTQGTNACLHLQVWADAPEGRQVSGQLKRHTRM